MDKRIAQNALNFFLSKRFSMDGSDFMAVVEVVRELQRVIADGPESDSPDGDTKNPES